MQLARSCVALAGLVVALATAPVASAALYGEPPTGDVTVRGTIAAGSIVTFDVTQDQPDARAGTDCMYSLVWDNAYGRRTFASLTTTSDTHGCQDWRVRLPYSRTGTWSMALQTQWSMSYTGDFTGVSTDRGARISYSSLPGFYIDVAGTGRTDEPLIVTGTPFGGYPLTAMGLSVFHVDRNEYVAGRVAAPVRSVRWTPKPADVGFVIIELFGEPSQGGGVAVQESFELTIIPGPTLSLVGKVPATARLGNRISVSATATGFVATSLRYDWYVDGRRVFTGRSGHLVFATPGAHRVKVVASDAKGHTRAKSSTVTVAR